VKQRISQREGSGSDAARRFRKYRRAFAFTLLSTLLSLASARADNRPREKAQRYRRAVPNQSIQAGGARIRVGAPVETVRQVINDFDHYSSFLKRYKDGKLQLQISAKLVGRSGDKRDVYLSVPIMKGAAKVWGVLRFDAARVRDGEEVLEGHLVKGNVSRLDARWAFRKVDDNVTHVSLELLIVPKVPVPGDVVTDESEFVSDVSVTGVRNEAEQKTRQSSQ
jgi:ribosome-associated toxin RatA of RatAB toxin-antitoxin module